MIEPIERKILARAVVLDPGPAELDGIRSCMSSGVSVDHLIDMALREGLGGLLYRSFKRSRVLETLPEREKQKLETYYYRVVRNNLRLIQDLKEVLGQSHRRNIRPVLLQGMDLIQDVYNDIGLRPMTDIDLFSEKIGDGENRGRP